MKLEESVINFKIAIRHKEEKHIIKQKFITYTQEYDNKDNHDVKDKLIHRELFLMYVRYMGNTEK